jgi:hypothetical protein
VRLADAAGVFAAGVAGDGAVPGGRLFFEHVHPTLAGNDLLARAFLPAVEAALPARVREPGRAGAAAAPGTAATPTPEQVAERLVYTDWNEYRMLSQVLALMGQHPFPEQYDHEERYGALAARLQALMDRATQELRQRTFDRYGRALEERPDDLLLRANYVEMLKEAGQRAAADRHIRVLMGTQPPMDWRDPARPAAGGG